MDSAARDRISAAEWIALRYATGERLGGGLCEVHLAHDRLGPSRGPVVLKRARGAARASLRTEVDLLLGCRHPAFRRVLATAREEDELVAVLEHVEGESLDRFLAAHPEAALSVAVDVLRGLVFLHAAGFVHGDLKPLNLLVSATGVRIIDLGLAVPIGAAIRGLSPGFSPPEARPGAPATVGGDLCALAATLRSCGAPLEGDLGVALRACLAEDPAARPATADTLLGMLGRPVRPVDRTGEVPRLSDQGLVASLAEASARSDGSVRSVEGEAGCGRTRLVEDVCRGALAAGRPFARVTLAEGHDPFAGLADLLLGFELDEPVRKAALGIAAAGRRGLPILVDDAEGAAPAVREALSTGAAALRELGRGSLVVVGADQALAEALGRAGAERASLARLGPEVAAEALGAASALTSDASVALVLEASQGRAGRAVRAAELLADRPELTAEEVRCAVEGKTGAAEPDRPPLPPELALDEAERLLEAGEASRAAALLRTAMPWLAEDAPPSRGGEAREAERWAASPGAGGGATPAGGAPARPKALAQDGAGGPSGRPPGSDRRALALLARAEARRGDLALATELLRRCEPIEDPELRVEAAGWLERQGRYDAASRLVGEAGGEGGDPRAVVIAARAACGLGELERAREIARRGLGAPALAAATECRLRCVLSDAARLAGDARAASAEGERAAEAACRQEDPTLLPQALARQAAAEALAGELPRARELYLRAFEEALAAGDIAGVPPYVLNLATAEHGLGEYGAALARYQEAARIGARLGRRVVEAAALLDWAGLLVDLGAVDEAGPILEKGARSAEEAHVPFYEAQARLVRAAFVGATSPRAGAVEAERAGEAFTRCGAEQGALEARLLGAELSATQGELASAARALDEVRAAFDAGGLAGRAALLSARVALGEGDLQRALREAGRCEKAAESASDPDLLGRALALAATVHERLGTGAAEPIAARARETLGRVSAMLPPGLREKYLASPGRLVEAVPRPAVERAPESRAGGHEPLRLWALVRRLLLEGSETRLLEAAVDEALCLTGAGRAFLLLRRDGRRPAVAVARNMTGEAASAGDRSARFSRSVAEGVLESGELVATTSPLSDASLQGAESVLYLGLRAILCVPIRGPRGVAGALYLDHNLDTARFGPEAVELVQALADIIGVALENARLHRDSQEKEIALARANEALQRENEQRSAEIGRLGHLLELHGGQVPLEAPGGLIGRSRALCHAVEVARRTAPSDLPVLIEGPSGTGKELVARYVHEASRRGGPFVAINCGALPATLLDSELFGHVKGAFTGADRDHPGLFRAAEGGTLLLDEVGEMPLEVQPRLLRVLQEGEVWPLGRDGAVSVDVRVVAATNRDLESQVRRGLFREDLFYRLAGVRIRVPALVERREDIPVLAAVFLKRACEECERPGLRLGRSAIRALLQHDWPGNVRQLEQAIRRGTLLAQGNEIVPSDLGLEGSLGAAERPVRSFDAEVVRQALHAAAGNRKKAAERLGVSRSTLYRWLERYDIT